VVLFPVDSTDLFVVSKVNAVNAHQIRFDFKTDQARRDTMVQTASWVAVAFLDTVKVQFTIDAPIVSQAPSDSWEASAALPARLFRIQRREAFRVRPLDHDAVHCVLRLGANEEVRMRVLDFSAGGLSLRWPRAMALPAQGTTFAHSRIEFGQAIAIPAELVSRQASEAIEALEGAYRLGFSYQNISAEAQRALQMAVMDIERKARFG
jgi:flagellar brake protein